MQKLKQQVALARRRLIVQQFLAALGTSLFVTLLIAAGAIAAQKICLAEIDGYLWAVGWLAGAIAVGFIAAGFWTAMVRRGEIDAALEIDQRFGLKERVSSTLALGPEEAETPIGRALVEDAVRRVDRLDIGERFQVSLGRRAWLPLVPAAIAFGLTFLADPTRATPPNAEANTVALAKQIQESTEPLRKKIEERKQLAKEKGLRDAEDLFKKIEEGARELKKNEQGDQEKALSKLNDLAKELENRREKLAAGEKLKEQLAAMKNVPGGPAEKMAKALQNGEMQKAKQELEKLQEQLAQGKLNEEQQKELAKQMGAMQEAMNKMAAAQQKAEQELKKQIDQAKQAGDKAGERKLQEQLDKLQSQRPQMDKLQDLANKLGQVAQSMKDGNTGEAQSKLNDLAGEIGQMQQQAEEMELLDDTLDEITQAKSSMNCKKCGGQGCKECGGQGKAGQGNQQGDGGQQGDAGQGDGQGNQPGDQFAKGNKGNNGGGIGPGIGRGEGGEGIRPDDLKDTKFYDSKVNQNVGKGSATATGYAEGPNRKGQALEEIKTQVEAAKREVTDPLTGQRLPKQQRDHVQEYFDAFRQRN